jgi:hypothetical protein
MCVILASLGDLVALYFAKPSLIAPIGSVNLAANVVISPLMLGLSCALIRLLKNKVYTVLIPVTLGQVRRWVSWNSPLWQLLFRAW